MATSRSNRVRAANFSGVRPQMVSTEASSGPFLPDFTLPVTSTPLIRPNSLINLGGTSTSSDEGWKEKAASRR